MPKVFNYDAVIAVADKLIARYGRKIIVIHPVDGPAVDTSRPWDTTVNPPAAPLNAPTMGVFMSFDRKSVDGFNIKATDFKLIFTATALPFDVSTRDTINDALYGGMSIIDVALVQPGSQKVLYTLQVRRG